MLNPGKTKGVFFDLFGTLFIYRDLKKAWNAWFEEFFELIRIENDISNDRFSEICSGFYSRPDPLSAGNGFTVYENRIIEFCNYHKLKCSESNLKKIADRTVDGWQKFVIPDPAVSELLSEIGKTKKTALISNFDHPRHIHKKLKENEWEKLFGTIVISGEVGVKKPDKRIFGFALDELELNPEDVIFVGDSREDIEGAQAAGIFPVLIARKDFSNNLQYGYNNGPEEDWFTGMKDIEIIENLAELKKFL